MVYCIYKKHITFIKSYAMGPEIEYKFTVWRDTEYLSVFSPNSGKYGPEKTPYLDTFHGVIVSSKDSTK